MPTARTVTLKKKKSVLFTKKNICCQNCHHFSPQTDDRYLCALNDFEVTKMSICIMYNSTKVSGFRIRYSLELNWEEIENQFIGYAGSIPIFRVTLEGILFKVKNYYTGEVLFPENIFTLADAKLKSETLII